MKRQKKQTPPLAAALCSKPPPTNRRAATSTVVSLRVNNDWSSRDDDDNASSSYSSSYDRRCLGSAICQFDPSTNVVGTPPTDAATVHPFGVMATPLAPPPLKSFQSLGEREIPLRNYVDI
jgi:hypothetical protein